MDEVTITRKELKNYLLAKFKDNKIDAYEYEIIKRTCEEIFERMYEDALDDV